MWSSARTAISYPCSISRPERRPCHEFTKKGVRVWSVQEGEQRFESHTDRLTNYIRFWQADGESQKTSMRTKTALGQMVEEGRFRGGNAPYGYRLEKSGILNKRNPCFPGTSSAATAEAGWCSLPTGQPPALRMGRRSIKNVFAMYATTRPGAVRNVQDRLDTQCTFWTGSSLRCCIRSSTRCRELPTT